MQDRPDLYSGPHKGLRNAMQASLIRLGKLDTNDAGEVSEVLADLRDLLQWCETHIDIEERFVHQAIDRKRPGALVTHVRNDHASHQREFALLRGDADAVERSLGEPIAVRKARARQLYLSFSRFVGENFVHMAFEETEINALLWELFSADELRAILTTILAGETPDQLTRSVRWLIPALDPVERAQIVGNARAGIPPAVFDHLLGVTKTLLSESEYAKLIEALGKGRAA